jgi:hypothetical protein
MKFEKNSLAHSKRTSVLFSELKLVKEEIYNKLGQLKTTEEPNFFLRREITLDELLNSELDHLYFFS